MTVRDLANDILDLQLWQALLLLLAWSFVLGFVGAFIDARTGRSHG